ncbi:uncharacterized protein LOC115680014 isoform X2 [Syzygium oleosum]|uniref:uncharacterized protein LOC115680014 isoform X2 n=1 Tax=Syzygium oleosum TaxID=219896 RepID=UPI0024BB50B1|nr:uncharacterized protein LOC115680014 isoform X2 [Syzygium oleosum]
MLLSLSLSPRFVGCSCVVQVQLESRERERERERERGVFLRAIDRSAVFPTFEPAPAKLALPVHTGRSEFGGGRVTKEEEEEEEEESARGEIDGRGGHGGGRDLDVVGGHVGRGAVVAPPLQPPPHLRLPRLRPRSVPQALHHLLRFKERRWDSKRMLGSGGMPSSHSATVTALAVAIGLQEGTGGSAFAIAVVLALVVMYDASGVRRHAGRQAELLNQIVCEFPPEHPLSSVRPLRELLGHTPLQVVAGAILGCVVGYLMRNTN